MLTLGTAQSCHCQHIQHVQACIEPSLLAALDGESESSTCAQLRATLTALLAASAPKKPGYWLKLLGGVALAAGAPVAAATGQDTTAGEPGKLVPWHHVSIHLHVCV